MKSRYLIAMIMLAECFMYNSTSFAKTTKSSKRAQSQKKSTKKTNTSTKGTSSKRAASTSSKSSKSNAKRAASTNSRRAASTNSRRAASTNARRQSSTTRNSARLSANSVQTTRQISETTSVSSNQCPVGQLLRKAFDDNGNETYYKSKTNTCDAPENTQEISWDMNDPTKLKQYTLKKGWIDQSEAIAFMCEDGYLLSKNTCKSFEDFCPLNEIIEKRNGEYINPFTDEACTPANKASVKKLTASENDSDIKTGMAYRFSCPDNYYVNDGNYIQCLECPTDKPYSTKDSNIGIKSCRVTMNGNSCEDGSWMGNGENSCQLYSYYNFTEIDIPNSGTLGAGLYDVSASEESVCKDDKKTPFVLTKETKFSKVSDETGSYFAVNGEILKNCTKNVTFKFKKADGSEGLIK